MTGLMAKQIAFLAFIAIIIPGVFVFLANAVNKTDGSVEENCGRNYSTIFKLMTWPVILYAMVCMYFYWDDRKQVTFMLGVAAAAAVFYFIHCVFIVFVASVLGSKFDVPCKKDVFQVAFMLLFCVDVAIASPNVVWGPGFFDRYNTIGKMIVALHTSPDKQSWSNEPGVLEYGQVLADYEKMYPEINPDSHLYNQALDLKISDRVEVLIGKGYPQVQALKLAVGEAEADRLFNHRVSLW